VKRNLFPFAVYTIISRDRFNSAIRRGGRRQFTEAKTWTTGRALLAQAAAEDLSMPVLFGDATKIRRLMGWGVLVDVRVTRGSTTFTAKDLASFKRSHAPHELVLKSTRKTIARGYQRPYAICLTPSFLEGRASRTTRR
jgi:hypothetical protein